jgi:gentisate 1,2-dioxygenase
VAPRQDGKATLFESPRLLVGLNAFEPGQLHELHAHQGMDKLYFVVDGDGMFLLEGRELPMRAGELMVAPEGVPHGIKNTGTRSGCSCWRCSRQRRKCIAASHTVWSGYTEFLNPFTNPFVP